MIGRYINLTFLHIDKNLPIIIFNIMWQIILTTLSATLFFGFTILSVIKFGLLSCYSAYAKCWQPEWHSKINWWQIVTIISALLIVPVTVFTGEGSNYQFFGFFAPASLLLVGASPEYSTDPFQNVIHQFGAWSAVVFIIAYSIAIPNLLWIIALLMTIALIIGLVIKGTLMFWAEMGMYLSTYIILYVTV